MAALEQQQHESPAAGGVTQLDFHTAMRDFKTMFPSMESDVIEVVLRANNGAVDATIDQLLAMNADNESERSRAPPPPASSEPLIALSGEGDRPPCATGATPPPTYNQAVPHDGGTSSNRRSSEHLIYHKFPCATANLFQPSQESLRAKFKWNPPLLGTLPHSFLRIETATNHHHHHHSSPFIGAKVLNSGSESRSETLSSALLQQKMEENERRRLAQNPDDPELSQYLEDERIAIFLQNEEFVQELRHNKDFMSTLEIDGLDRSLPDGPHVPGNIDSEDAFKEKLRKMGKVSRKKFNQLATLFSRRKRGSFQQLLGGHSHHNSNPSRDNLLLNNEEEYSTLQNEGSDSEEPPRGNSWNSHGGSPRGRGPRELH